MRNGFEFVDDKALLLVSILYSMKKIFAHIWTLNFLKPETIVAIKTEDRYI